MATRSALLKRIQSNPIALQHLSRPKMGSIRNSTHSMQTRQCHRESQPSQRPTNLVQDADKKLLDLAIKSSKKIFLYNLKRKMSALPEAFGMEASYVSRVSDAFEILYDSQKHQITDSRSNYHLQTACLVLASYRILTDQIGVSRDSAIKTIQGCTGDSNSWIEQAIRSGIASISRLIASRNTYGALCKQARAMADIDFGDAFTVSHTASHPPTASASNSAAMDSHHGGRHDAAAGGGGGGGPVTPPDLDTGSRHVTTVKKCFYFDFFKFHNAPELTGPIFCRADAALFESAVGLDAAALREGRHGARFALERTLAEGAKECSFVIERTDSAQGGGGGRGGGGGAGTGPGAH